MSSDVDEVAVSRGKKVRLTPPEAVSQAQNKLPDTSLDDKVEQAREGSEKYKDDIRKTGLPSESTKNDDIVSRVLSLDFQEDEFAELSLMLNLGGSGSDRVEVPKVSLLIVET